MHNFNELIFNCTSFTLNALEKANETLVKSLQEQALTSSVRGMQMIQLQKAVLATGMFSLFEAELQRELSCSNGFKEATKILCHEGEVVLKNRFNYFILAINVLKHGQGRSYDILVTESNSLPFKIKLPGMDFFDEGDISEVSTLIEVDNKFVLNCAELITQVSNVIRTKNQ